MSRREFITLLGGAAAAWPLAARAQQPAVPVIGWLSSRSPGESAHLVTAFRQGLAEAGYADGRNVVVEFRWADGRNDRVATLAADLVGRRVAVLAAVGGNVTGLAATALTTTIPIVFASGIDPVKVGLVASLNRPGGNVTGVSFFSAELTAKVLGLLNELVPNATVVALLVNPNSPESASQPADAHAAARVLGKSVLVFNASTASEIDAAFATLVRERAGALLVGGDPILTSRRAQIVALATRHGVPLFATNRDFAAAGALMGYGNNIPDAYRKVGVYAVGFSGEKNPATPELTTTGRDREPLQRVDQFAAVIGRRGGKSRAMATLATYIAGLCDHSDALVPGERGVLLCVALDQRVAKIILDYAEASFERSPILKQLIASRTADALELTNGITLEVRPASFRKLRGPTYVAVIADELAFWYVDAAYANPDVEILNAIEPGLATTGGPLILASSPHARRGVLWEVFKRHYGAGGDPLILVAHGASRTLNPSLPQRVVDRALEKDRTRATAEYLAEFRTDVEGFVALEVVESCVGDHREMLPAAGITYRAFVDPSGGSEDAMTLAIAHKTTTPDERVIVDTVREVRPPFSPSAVVDDFAVLLKSYRVSKVVGDHYGGEFVKEPFRKNGISYELCKQRKSDLFRDMLPLLNSGRISLPRHDRLIAQIVGLERRVSRAGRDSIDHAPGAHDDIANAVSGVVGAISGVGSAWMNLIWD